VFYFGGFFSQTGIFAGFSLHIINLAVRISAAMMAGDIIFLGCRTVYKGAMDGARGGEYYISKPLWSSGKIYASGSPSSGLKKKRTILFLEISRGFSVYFVGRISEAAMGGPRSSFRGRRSSVGGCSLAQKGAA
jgi:hypothetical protein